MSAIRRSNFIIGSIFGIGLTAAGGDSALAQTVVLPNIDVTWTRLSSGVTGSNVGGAGVPVPGVTGVGVAGSGVAGLTMTGTSTSVITSAQIEQSPAQSLPDILSQHAGVQIQHLLSGVNGSHDTVDLRGFGAFAPSNVLILVNGRRYQDFDLQGFDFSTIPLNSIDHIEITRGNSGTVLYGDGAVGGVINIVTKTGSGAFSGRIEGAAGSFNYKELRASATGSSGPWSGGAFANGVASDGYRVNSDLREQSVVANLNYRQPMWSAYLNFAANNQQQGLPGALPNAPSLFVPYSLNTPQQSNTPLDRANQQGVNITAGFTSTVAPGIDLIVDGGVRRKFQQATFFSYSNPPFFVYDASTAVPSNYVSTVLTTTSFTPRFDVSQQWFGVPNHLLAGVDIYNTQYNSDRPTAPGLLPVHSYDINQLTTAVYAMNTATVRPNLDLSIGGRLQRDGVTALDRYNAAIDPNAFFYGTNPQAPPLTDANWQYAAHTGYEYRVNQAFTLFGRAARAFRVPNADERVGSGNPFGIVMPAMFDLKTQTSYDAEQGFRVKVGRFNFETSAYVMELNNEIHFLPALGQDVNLDPTQRIGWEAIGSVQVNDDVRLRAGAAYVKATFREGTYAGKDVPLVSAWTGSAGVTWNIVQKLVVLDIDGRFWSDRRMDNDQPNIQPVIPGNATVDVKLGGESGHFFWAATVLNVFDVAYYDYAIASGGFPAGPFGPASPPTIGAFNAYPLAGRTYMVRAGATF